MAGRKQLKGVVTSTKMDKTVVVSVSRTMRHPKYKKVVKVSKKFYAHTLTEHGVGDEVLIEESKPISKLKRWRVVSS